MLLLRTLFSHYRSHPVQGLFLLAGITIANVLLVGTLLINAQARASYAEGEQLLRAQPVATLRAHDGTRSIDERSYIELRRRGHDTLAPLLRRWVRLASGDTVELLGIDPFAMPRQTAQDGSAGPGQAAASAVADDGLLTLAAPASVNGPADDRSASRFPAPACGGRRLHGQRLRGRTHCPAGNTCGRFRLPSTNGKVAHDPSGAVHGRRLRFQGLLATSSQTAPGLRLPFAHSPNRGRRVACGSTVGRFSQFTQPPYALWGAPSRLRQLGWREGSEPLLASGRKLPPVTALADTGLGHRLVLDIGVLQELSDSRGALSDILVFAAPADRLQQLKQDLPAQLQWLETSAGLDPAQLTRSFHLNLAAMGLLAFVVGVFLIYNALAFSYTDRRELLRKLRLAGVTRRHLAAVLAFELAIFVAAGSLLGWVLGSWLAALLLPGVGQTLAQLYAVYIAYPDGWLNGGLGLALLMTALASGLCMLFPLREALAMPLLERQTAGWGHHALVRRDQMSLLVGLGLLLLAALLAAYAHALWLALACMASLLLGAALCLPATLRVLLAGLAHMLPARRALANWLIADSRWLLGPASLALMAITLALVANSGLNTMIGSFRAATDDWLQQRLVAQIYLSSEVDSARLADWLQDNAPEVSLTERYSTQVSATSPDGAVGTVEVISLPVDERFRASIALLRALPGGSESFRRSQGVFVSERAWRLDGWRPGTVIDLCAGALDMPVLGVYRDYGNPQSQWMVSPDLFQGCWPGLLPSGYGLVGPQQIDWDRLRSDLVQQAGFDDSQVVDQRALMARGMAVFDRTFTVTHALNALTLLVACIGIFCAVSAIHHHRLPQQALLSALGVSRRERAGLLLLQWGLLGLFCVVLVWPFGTALAWVLSAVVTPVAFGWSFELQLMWRHLPALALLAIGSLVLAIVLPSLQLLRATPGELLRARPV